MEEFNSSFVFAAKYVLHDRPATSPGAFIAFRQVFRLPKPSSCSTFDASSLSAPLPCLAMCTLVAPACFFW